MPNWCYTEYAFYGDEEFINDFEKKIREYTSKNFIENGFGTTWLGNIVMGFGFPYEGNNFTFRGSIIDIEREIDTLMISTETAWSPMPEMWDAIIEKYYTDEGGNRQLSYTFLSEEPGMEVYINTDMSGEFFRERYVLEVGEIPGHQNYETFYMESEEEVIDTVNCLFDTDLTNFRETVKFIKECQNRLLQGDGFLSFHEFASEY